MLGSAGGFHCHAGRPLVEKERDAAVAIGPINLDVVLAELVQRHLARMAEWISRTAGDHRRTWDERR